MFAQQCSPEFTGIFFCQPGKFVNETFGSEAGVRMSYRPPPLHRNIHFRLLIFNRQVGNLIRQIVGAFDRRGVVALGHHRLEGRPRHDGLPDQPRSPDHRVSAGINTAGDGVQICRAVPAAVHVVFARPNHFDRSARGFGHVHRLHHEIGLRIGAPAESSA